MWSRIHKTKDGEGGFGIGHFTTASLSCRCERFDAKLETPERNTHTKSKEKANTTAKTKRTPCKKSAANNE